MPRSGPMTMTFPPFAGTVRSLVIANVAVFFGIAILGWLLPGTAVGLLRMLQLHPYAVVHGAIWQLFTYSFVHVGILEILFAMLTLWFCGSMIEMAFGGRWLAELYFTSVAGGAIIATALSFTRALYLFPDALGRGAWAGLFGVLIAIAVHFGDQDFYLFPLPFRIRAKYLVAIYILVSVAMLLKNYDSFGALLQLAGAFSGWMYLKFAPRRGLAFGFSEQFYGMRNAYYRARRRRAARKFEVYMGKQGRQVRFDDEGRYIDPDDPRRRDPRNPNDKRWMN